MYAIRFLNTRVTTLGREICFRREEEKPRSRTEPEVDTIIGGSRQLRR